MLTIIREGEATVKPSAREDSGGRIAYAVIGLFDHVNVLVRPDTAASEAQQACLQRQTGAKRHHYAPLARLGLPRA